MRPTRIPTDLVEEIRLPVGGRFIITDHVGHQIFRIEEDGDIFRLGDVAMADAADVAAAAVTPAAHVTPETATPQAIAEALIAAGLMEGAE